MTTPQQQALFQRDPTYDYPVLERGEGIYLYDTDGKRYIDGAAGASNIILGHGRTDIAQALSLIHISAPTRPRLMTYAVI